MLNELTGREDDVQYGINDVLQFGRSKVIIDKCKIIMQVVCQILIDDMIRY